MRYRNELKFILSYQTSERIKRRIKGVMAPDSHSGGIYTVSNIYVDDMYDTFYNDKHFGKYRRDKYRARYYNGDLSFIRFENKHKDGSLSYKNSVIMTKDELSQMASGDFGFMDKSENPLWQAMNAIQITRGLRPSAAFTYVREAYVYPPGDVRITFDSSMRPDSLKIDDLDTVSEYAKNGGASNNLSIGAAVGFDLIMELKYTGFLPTVIAGMLQDVPIIHTEMSKYCFMRERRFTY
ncbi:MAG: polyphosphate polymerase domain-containing protein [Oscillospiraceae bacterium]|nr:polyphosphate polymerase domain-containing protein [Oscillospiraceae bacterium]